MIRIDYELLKRQAQTLEEVLSYWRPDDFTNILPKLKNLEGIAELLAKIQAEKPFKGSK